jgi:hypothetical protein
MNVDLTIGALAKNVIALFRNDHIRRSNGQSRRTPGLRQDFTQA